MNKLLVVVDMQNDFITGVFGTPEAQAIIPNVVKKISEWVGDIYVTQDTHTENYMNTQEGKNLPVPHCIEDTKGHRIIDEVMEAVYASSSPLCILNKYTFGSTALPELIRGKDYDYIELVGVCTGICVVSNALLLKANYPETHIAVDASCCACVTPESHQAALTTMKMCQIDVID